LLGNTIISNDVGAVDILISRQNIDLNAIEIKDKFTNRPLHLACLNPYTIQIAKLLLEKGIDINGQDFLGDTALHWAVRQNNQDAIKLLVKNKINTTILNKAGKNASYWSKKYKSMELKPSKL
jgi:ankyrin repeat protein